MKTKSKSLVCNCRRVPFGSYMIVWGPGKEDRGILKREPRIEHNSVSFILLERGTRDNRYLHLINKPVYFVREITVKNLGIHDEKGTISWDGPAADRLTIVRFKCDPNTDTVLVWAKTEIKGIFREYKFVNCPVLLDLRA